MCFSFEMSVKHSTHCKDENDQSEDIFHDIWDQLFGSHSYLKAQKLTRVVPKTLWSRSEQISRFL